MSGPGPVLVVAHDDDEGAWAVCSTLRARHGEDAAVAASVEWLTTRARWSHEFDGGIPLTRIAGAHDVGGEPSSDLIGGHLGAVLNRVRWIPPGPFGPLDDVRYWGREWSALLLSWLAGIGAPVVNPARPERWLSQTTGDVLRARVAAFDSGTSMVGLRASSGPSAAGGPAEPTWAIERGTDSHRFLVAGDGGVGAPTADWAERGRALVAGAGLTLAEVTLSRRRGERDWAFESLDPQPSLQGPGEAEAVADLLGGLSSLTSHAPGHIPGAG